MKATWDEVLTRRLMRHGMVTPLAGIPGVASTICGVHAQVPSASELSIGLRLDGATRSDIQAALRPDQTLIRAFGPRGTVHLLATADLPMWTAALPAIPSRPTDLMSPSQVDEVVAAIAEALSSDELTIDELDEAVLARTPAWAADPVIPAFQGSWPRWRHALSIAGHRGALCFGAGRARKVTYTKPPAFTPMPQEQALAQLVSRYLHAYGPATSTQFAQWLSAPRDWASRLFAALDLTEFSIEGTSAWSADSDMPPATPTGLRLLPYFDVYVVGSHPRTVVYPGPAADRALSRGQAGNFPVLLMDGKVAGVWHLKRSGKRLNITVEPLSGSLTATQTEQLSTQADRIGHILEGTPSLTVGPISVGPHA